MNFKGTNRTSWVLVLSVCKQWRFCDESVSHSVCCYPCWMLYQSTQWPWKFWDLSMVQLNMSQGDRIYSRRTGQLSCWGYPYFWTTELSGCFEKLNWRYSFVFCSSTRESGFWIYIYVRKIINKLHGFAMEIADFAGFCFLLLLTVQLLLYCKDPRCTS